MKTTLKLKINLMQEYLGLHIYPTKPYAALPNLVRLFIEGLLYALVTLAPPTVLVSLSFFKTVFSEYHFECTVLCIPVFAVLLNETGRNKKSNCFLKLLDQTG
jgi:hypothetical protein